MNSLIKPVKKIINYSVIAAVLVAFFVFAKTGKAAWQDPTAAPPANNPPGFIQNISDVNAGAQTGNMKITGQGIADILKATSQICLGTGLGSCKTSWSEISGLWQTGASGVIYYSGGRVGIGTNSPAYRLHVSGGSDSGTASVGASYGLYSAATAVGGNGVYGYAGASGGVGVRAYGAGYGIYSAAGNNYFAGNVGVGRTTPNADLEVAGDIVVDADNANNGSYGPNMLRFGGYGSGEAIASSRVEGAPNRWGLDFYTGVNYGGIRMSITNYGNVGIGTINPTSKLEVAGQIKITGGSPGIGRVLVSDASGLGSWTPLSSVFTEVDPTWIGGGQETGPISHRGGVSAIGEVGLGGFMNVMADTAIATGKTRQGDDYQYSGIRFGSSGIGIGQTHWQITYRNGNTWPNENGSLLFSRKDTSNPPNWINPFILMPNGNIGVGVEDWNAFPPNAGLDVRGTARIKNSLEITHPGNTNYGVALSINQNEVGSGDGPKIEFVKKLNSTTNKYWNVGIIDGVGVGSFVISETSDSNSFGYPHFVIKQGAVGIGTHANPNLNAKLHIATDVPYNLLLDKQTGATLQYTIGSNLGYSISSDASENLIWRSNGSIERMRLTPLGNLGVGTASPTAKLEVAGQIKITGGSPGAGKVLTSDASGLATWQALSTGTGGSGTANYISKWVSAGSLGNSTIVDDGTNIKVTKVNSSLILGDDSSQTIRLLGSNQYGSFIQVGANSADTLGILNIARRDTIQSPISRLNVFATTSYFAGNIGINNSTAINANSRLHINAGSGNEGLRITSATNYSPLNIMNTSNVDIFRVDQTGSLAVGSIPWERLTNRPSNTVTTKITGTYPNLTIASNAIGTTELANNAVSGNKILDGAVTNTKIYNGSITADKIGSGAVIEAKIGNGAVTNSKIGQMGATTGQVLKWNGTFWAPAADNDTNTAHSLDIIFCSASGFGSDINNISMSGTCSKIYFSQSTDEFVGECPSGYSVTGGGVDCGGGNRVEESRAPQSNRWRVNCDGTIQAFNMTCIKFQ